MKHGVSNAAPEANNNPLHGNRHCCPVTKFQQKNSKGIMMEIF
jgi:hypothetical protein